MTAKCQICKKTFDLSDLYEYRGFIACSEHFDELQERVNYKRAEVIEELNHKTKPLEGLNFGDNVIGRINRKLLKPQVEIAKKESQRLKDYESGKL